MELESGCLSLDHHLLLHSAYTNSGESDYTISVHANLTLRLVVNAIKTSFKMLSVHFRIACCFVLMFWNFYMFYETLYNQLFYI